MHFTSADFYFVGELEKKKAKNTSHLWIHSVGEAGCELGWMSRAVSLDPLRSFSCTAHARLLRSRNPAS